jgi:hypothetical protein
MSNVCPNSLFFYKSAMSNSEHLPSVGMLVMTAELERTQNRDVIAQCKALSWNLAEGTEEDH